MDGELPEGQGKPLSGGDLAASWTMGKSSRETIKLNEKALR